LPADFSAGKYSIRLKGYNFMKTVKLIFFSSIFILINSYSAIALAQNDGQVDEAALQKRSLRERFDERKRYLQRASEKIRQVKPGPMPGRIQTERDGEDMATTNDGCPEGTYAFQINEEQTAITVSFANFITEKLEGRTRDRRFEVTRCALATTLQIPPGKRLKLSYVDYTGFMMLPNPLSGIQLTSFVTFARPENDKRGKGRGMGAGRCTSRGVGKRGLCFSYRYQGQTTEGFAVSSGDLSMRQAGNDTIVSRCGGEAILRIITDLRVVNRTGQGKAMATIDSVGAAAQHIPGLAVNEDTTSTYLIDWENCSGD
jgi:Domain of unknown function (DUF4360)